MDPAVRELLDRSFHRCPGADANREIARIRDELAQRFGQAYCYEVVIPAERCWREADPDLLPRFANHLRSKKIPFGGSEALFVAAFHEQTLYFLRSSDFARHLLDRENLSVGDVPARIEAWSGRQASAPLALPPPGDDE